MSQSPFPQDLYAVARLDWCRPSTDTSGGAVSQLLCNNLARQCGSFTNATRDQERIARTAPQLQRLLRAPEIESWSGKCPVAKIEGVCGIGGAQSFQEQLWQGLAEPRERSVYDAIAGQEAGPSASAIQLLQPQFMDAPQPGARAARLSEGQLVGLPFL